MRQRSEEWFKARCGRITGSRFAAAMSARRTRTYQWLVEELVRERVTGATERSHPTPAMQWGIEYESAAREWYARSRRVSVHQIGFVVHPDFDYVGVSPDGLVGNDGLVEIKCPQPRGFEQIMSSACVPARYRWQVQGQLWVCRREWLDFVCFYPPDRARVIRVYPDHSDFSALAERCEEIQAEVVHRLHAESSHPKVGLIRENRASEREIEQYGRSSTARARRSPVTNRDAVAGAKDESARSYSRWWIAAIIVAVVLYLAHH